MNKDEMFSQLTHEVLNDAPFKASFGSIEEHISMEDFKKIQESIEKEFKGSWDEIWTGSSELIQEAQKQVQNLEIEQGKFNRSEEGSKFQEKRAEQVREREELVKSMLEIEQKIKLKKDDRDVQCENYKNSQKQPSKETKRSGFFESYQKKKKQKQEYDKLRTLEQEIIDLQEQIIAARQSVARQISLMKRDHYKFERLAQEAYPQLEEAKVVAEKAVEKAKYSLRTKLQEQLILVVNRNLQEIKSPDTEHLPYWFYVWGITEVFASSYEIITTHRNKLARLLEEMPGGSIGISGPRGAGKSTLMGSFCGTDSHGSLKERSVFSVMLSAPVKYETRDFILHIFSSVCNLVRANFPSGKTESDFQGYRLDGKPEEINSSLSSNLRENIRQLFGERLLSMVKHLGPMLITSSFLLAYTSTFTLPQYDKVVTKTAALNSPHPKSSPQPLQKEMPLDIILFKYFTALGVTPSSLLMWGIILSILGFLSSPSLIKKQKYYPPNQMIGEKDDLSGEAETYLKRIQFQQSYTSNVHNLRFIKALKS
jgi:hypothetical protein